MTGRHYKIDGERYPSVTTILGTTLANPGLAQWRGHVGNTEADRVMREAAECRTYCSVISSVHWLKLWMSALASIALRPMPAKLSAGMTTV